MQSVQCMLSSYSAKPNDSDSQSFWWNLAARHCGDVLLPGSVVLNFFVPKITCSELEQSNRMSDHNRARCFCCLPSELVDERMTPLGKSALGHTVLAARGFAIQIRTHLCHISSDRHQRVPNKHPASGPGRYLCVIIFCNRRRGLSSSRANT